jgi:hypothetical protein
MKVEPCAILTCSVRGMESPHQLLYNVLQVVAC